MSDDRDTRGTQPGGFEPAVGEPVHPVAPAPPLDDRPIPGGSPVTPDDRWWTDVDRRHRLVTIVGITVGVLVLAIGVGVAVAIIGSSMSQGSDEPSPGAVQTIPETSETVEATIPLPSETTSTTGTTGTIAPLAVDGRGRYVAYRKEGAVWVATESGEDPKRLFSSAEGPYALSPDAKTLAVVDASSQTFSLVDVGTGRTVLVGKAVPDRPSWSADSSFVIYSSQPAGSHDTVVERVARDGSGRRTIGPGVGGRVAADGSIAAISTSRTAQGTPIVIFQGGTSRRIGENIVPNALALVGPRIVFADAGGLVVSGSARTPSVRSLAKDGSGLKTLVAKPSVGEGVFFGDIVPSPDASWIAYAETGDDGYSRLFSMPAGGGTPKALSPRRDAYILGWSADGTEIIFVEGNEVQEEQTRLMAMRPDGTGRRTIVDGAGQ